MTSRKILIVVAFSSCKEKHVVENSWREKEKGYPRVETWETFNRFPPTAVGFMPKLLRWFPPLFCHVPQVLSPDNRWLYFTLLLPEGMWLEWPSPAFPLLLESPGSTLMASICLALRNCHCIHLSSFLRPKRNLLLNSLLRQPMANPIYPRKTSHGGNPLS